MALSTDCIKEKNLNRAIEYIKRKNKPPRFHENVIAKATELLESQPKVNSASQSFELSDSFFDFGDRDKGTQPKMLTVHAIGKPERLDPNHRGPISRANTYRVMKWEVGKEITDEMAKTHMDAFGCIYVWFRWLDDRWTWKCVTKSDFDTLRKVQK